MPDTHSLLQHVQRQAPCLQASDGSFEKSGLLIYEFVQQLLWTQSSTSASQKTPRMQIDDVVVNSEAALTCGCKEEMMMECVFVRIRSPFADSD